MTRPLPGPPIETGHRIIPGDPVGTHKAIDRLRVKRRASVGSEHILDLPRRCESVQRHAAQSGGLVRQGGHGVTFSRLEPWKDLEHRDRHVDRLGRRHDLVGGGGNHGPGLEGCRHALPRHDHAVHPPGLQQVEQHPGGDAT